MQCTVDLFCLHVAFVRLPHALAHCNYNFCATCFSLHINYLFCCCCCCINYVAGVVNTCFVCTEAHWTEINPMQYAWHVTSVWTSLTFPTNNTQDLRRVFMSNALISRCQIVQKKRTTGLSFSHYFFDFQGILIWVHFHLCVCVFVFTAFVVFIICYPFILISFFITSILWWRGWRSVWWLLFQ